MSSFWLEKVMIETCVIGLGFLGIAAIVAAVELELTRREFFKINDRLDKESDRQRLERIFSRREGGEDVDP